MRRILSISTKERLRAMARVLLGLDIRFANSRKFDIRRYELDATHIRRFFHLEYLLRQIEHVEGRIVECGVGPGRTIFAFSIITEALAKPRMIVGYDTFEGIPAPGEEDGKANAHKVGWWNYSQQQVLELLEFNGLDRRFISENIDFIPGIFSESLSSYDGAPIALLHLDIDLYESYVTVLNSLYQFVAPGGIVAFDEYRKPIWPGATQAVDEFFADRPEEVVKSPVTELYYVVKSETES